ncbi:MAG: hypothetical protein RLO50_23640 [Azospirillaceae bacterium]
MLRVTGSVLIALVTFAGAQAQSIDQDLTSIVPGHSVCDECQDLVMAPFSMKEVISTFISWPNRP